MGSQTARAGHPCLKSIFIEALRRICESTPHHQTYACGWKRSSAGRGVVLCSRVGSGPGCQCRCHLRATPVAWSLIVRGRHKAGTHVLKRDSGSAVLNKATFSFCCSLPSHVWNPPCNPPCESSPSRSISCFDLNLKCNRCTKGGCPGAL
jgi:hypothetical protein